MYRDVSITSHIGAEVRNEERSYIQLGQSTERRAKSSTCMDSSVILGPPKDDEFTMAESVIIVTQVRVGLTEDVVIGSYK